MGYSNNYSGNHVDVSKMTTEEKKAYYEEQRERQEEYEAAQGREKNSLGYSNWNCRRHRHCCNNRCLCQF